MIRMGLRACALSAMGLAVSACKPILEQSTADSGNSLEDVERSSLIWAPAVPSHTPLAVAASVSPVTQAAVGAPLGFGFAPVRIYPGERPSGKIDIHAAVAAGDFNGDGRDDIAALIHGYSIDLYLQGASGITTASFSQPMTMGSQLVILVNDFNEDGIDDLAVMLRNGGVGLLASQGAGQLPLYQDGYPGHANTSTDFVHDWATLDVNGDGHQDIVTAQTSCANGVLCPSYDVLFGNGQGSFSRGSPVYVVSTYHMTQLYAEDVNDDGLQDLVMATEAYSGRPEGAPYSEIFVALAKNGGGLESPRLVAGSPTASPLSFGDINGDGRRDLVRYGDVRMKLPGGGYSERYALDGGMESPANIVLADFNGDGFTDLVMHQFDLTFPTTLPYLAVYLQKDGALQAPFRIVDPYIRYGFDVAATKSPYAVGDFNSDGCKDLAIAIRYDGMAIFDGQRCSRVPMGGNQAPRPWKG